MRFLIIGADKDSGDERSIVTDAEDEKTALETAKSEGIFPYRVEIRPIEVKQRLFPSNLRRKEAFAAAIGFPISCVVVIGGVVFLFYAITWISESLNLPSHSPDVPSLAASAVLDRIERTGRTSVSRNWTPQDTTGTPATSHGLRPP